MSTNFVVGEYASVDSILEYLLTSRHSVATSEHICPNGHVVDQRRRERFASEFLVFADRGMSVHTAGLFPWLHNPFVRGVPFVRFTSCEKVLLRNASDDPPLLSVSLGENEPHVENALSIKCDHDVTCSYQLRGVMRITSQHE